MKILPLICTCFFTTMSFCQDANIKKYLSLDIYTDKVVTIWLKSDDIVDEDVKKPFYSINNSDPLPLFPLLSGGKMLKCKSVGSKNSMVIFIYNYGSPYNPGVIIRFNKTKNTAEKLYFNEKSYPKFAVSKQGKFMLFFINIGTEMTNKKYIVYNYNKDDEANPHIIGMNKIPKILGKDLQNVE